MTKFVWTGLLNFSIFPDYSTCKYAMVHPVTCKTAWSVRPWSHHTCLVPRRFLGFSAVVAVQGVMESLPILRLSHDPSPLEKHLEVGFCTLCFCFPTKILHLNAPFFPLKRSVSPKKATKMLWQSLSCRGFFINRNVLTECYIPTQMIYIV